MTLDELLRRLWYGLRRDRRLADLEDEMRLAISRAGLKTPAIERLNRYGGVLPSHGEIVGRVSTEADTHLRGVAV